ncbi:hypothetical protein LC593_07355 [Nostoc sp. CHAB 5844]|nr:hypothetical protein [Nostoc sp. CHAB 5844]
MSYGGGDRISCFTIPFIGDVHDRIDKRFCPNLSSMNGSNDIDAQITLPMELYQAIAQRAQAHGHSVGQEIVALLTPLLMQISNELEEEFAAWEAASDEDWLSTEGILASLGE